LQNFYKMQNLPYKKEKKLKLSQLIILDKINIEIHIDELESCIAQQQDQNSIIIQQK